jgi:hypothetical protein
LIQSDQKGKNISKLHQMNKKTLPTPPKQIKPVTRLKSDILALTLLFDMEKPGQVLLGASQVYTILYGFEDASGSGF